MATFGFSVGDFVTCLQLIREVIKALSDSKGSAAEYQSLFQTLVSLNQSLAASELMYLQWDTQTSNDAQNDNAKAMINGMLFERQQCKQLMENFLKNSQPYADAFVKERSRLVVRNWRKVTWLFQKEEVKDLERGIQRHLQALRIYTDALFQNQSAANAEAMKSQMGSILSDVVNLRTDVSVVVKALQTWDSPRSKSLGYPWEASAALSDNVLLLDATGRSVLLPMLFLSSPVVLHDLLNLMYRGIPGHRKIMRREYNITDEDADGVLVEDSNWNSVIRPGMQISLNVVLKASLSWNMHRCPRCSEAVLGHSLQGKRRRCQKCQLTFRVFDKERLVDETEATSTLESSADNATDVVAPPDGRHSSESKLNKCRKEKPDIAEDYFFHRVHYQRDIRKVRLQKPFAATSEGACRAFEISELPPLHQAAVRGNILELKSLLDEGADIEGVIDFEVAVTYAVDLEFKFHGAKALHLASFFGRSNAINLLLDRGANLEALDTDNASPLVYAGSGRDPGVAIILLGRGANINASDHFGATVLHYASSCGISWLVRLLIQHGADVNAPNFEGDTSGHYTVWLGDSSVLSILLECDLEISARGESGYDLLNTACALGHEGVARILLTHGADITTRDDDGDTPLHNAAWNGSESTLKLLLEHGADVTSRNYEGRTPLHYASWQGSEATVKSLLEHGADVASQDNGGRTPLHDASWNGSDGAIKKLLECGAALESENAHGETALLMAIRNGHIEIVKLLLRMGASHNCRDHRGYTPLHNASLSGHIGIINSLLESGADHTARNDEQDDPLLCALWNENAIAAKVLLDHGVSVISRDNKGNTPLLAASCKGLKEVVRILLDAGADVNAFNLAGHTPIHMASYYGKVSVVELLLAEGADANVIDEEGCTALHNAVWGGSERIVKVLLDRGGDPAKQDNEGRLPLHYAMKSADLGTVNILLEAGKANINCQDYEGLTALHIAALWKSTEIRELLLEHGADNSIKDNNGNTATEYYEIGLLNVTASGSETGAGTKEEGLVGLLETT